MRLKYKDFDSSFDARAKYYEAMGLGKASSYTGSSKQNQAMLKLMKQNKFQKGGYIGSLVKSTGEDGFILANKGEYVLSQEKLETLSRALMNAQPLINSFSKPMPINSNGLGNTITNDVEMNISMYGVQDVQGLVTELQKDNRFQKIVQQMTVGTMSGGNKLGKYKY